MFLHGRRGCSLASRLGFRGFGSVDLNVRSAPVASTGRLLPRRWRDLPSCETATARPRASAAGVESTGRLRFFTLRPSARARLNSRPQSGTGSSRDPTARRQFTSGPGREPACGLLASPPNRSRSLARADAGITELLPICAAKRVNVAILALGPRRHDGPGDETLGWTEHGDSGRFELQPGEQAQAMCDNNLMRSSYHVGTLGAIQEATTACDTRCSST